MTIKTQNEAWGFWGTMARQPTSAPNWQHEQRAWDFALAELAERTGCDEFEARAFLDSKHGRHFADEVIDAQARLPLPQAIAAAATKWMAWKISRVTSRQTGIPAGLPYLTGWVMASTIEADADAE